MLLQMAEFHYFLLLRNIPLCMCVFIHLSVSGHLGFFSNLAIVNDTALNIGMYVSFQVCVFVFSIYPGVEFLGHLADLFSVFWGILLVSIATTPVYIPTVVVYKGSLLSTFLPAFVICELFDDNHSDSYEVIS